MTKTPVEKLLSHRFRGYAPVEHTFSGFLEAAKSSVKYFEIDTRASKDGVVYVFHDPYIHGHIFPQTGSTVIDSINIYNDEPVPRLDDALRIFKTDFSSDTVFCLDIKDIGFEKEHIRLIEKHGLEKQVAIVSWCALALMNFSREGFSAPLFLSYQSLFSYGLRGRLTEFLAQNRIKVKKYNVFTGKNVFESIPRELYQGYFHSLRCRTLPDKLLKVIRKSGGGVCVAKNLICPELVSYCNENGLRLWVYSVNEINAYRRFASMDGVDMIFSDRAESIFKEL
ncbi:glycerophosphodiester phosphodiesterase [Geovibrio thiophilus]|uniref:Glycerophosphodiester phosphodiesterase n=1 Tax=Geovibrio thiophilus TaxID=139438 RepID=A0A410JY29_9BACT|nr:glycerophosphodiester phosphodiesterase [Geovibrio thiophilus]QAR32951.1 glycerophosphodiester phosphodiesterase [Geovibrio thiophilus]